MLMRDSKQVMMQVTMIAGIGMPHLGGTTSSCLENGTP